MEMVKEWYILIGSHLMINDEISSLDPSRRQHSFNYDDDDSSHYPFLSLSAHSSSQDSLQASSPLVRPNLVNKARWLQAWTGIKKITLLHVLKVHYTPTSIPT